MQQSLTHRNLDPVEYRELYELARKHGLSLRKDRARTLNLDHQGGYRLIDPFFNSIVAGERFDLDANDVRDWLAGRASQ